MSIKMNEEILYSLLFVDDQVTVAEDIEADSLFLKLIGEYEKKGLEANVTKTEHAEGHKLQINKGIINNLSQYKCLEVTLTTMKVTSKVYKITARKENHH